MGQYENDEINKFEIEQEVRENLSLKSYVYLINEYIKLTDIIKMQHNESENKLFKIKTTIDVLKENNIKIPEELNSIHSNLYGELSLKHGYLKLTEDISKIVSIKNLRYLIGDIARKENLSLEAISILIGCELNTLDNLVHNVFSIKKSDFEKFINYYGIKEIIEYWNGRYVHEL